MALGARSRTDWPPEDDGDEGNEGGRRHGRAVIATELDDASFSLSRSAGIERFGDHPVRRDHGHVGAAEAPPL